MDINERYERASGERDAFREELADLRRQLDRMREERDREAHDRQTASDAWNDMRRQRDASLRERDEARAELAQMKASRDEARAVARAWSADLCALALRCDQGGDEYPRKAVERRLSEQEAELSRLRARMPSGAELEAFRYVPKCIQPNLISVNGVSARAIKKHIRAWLARQEESDD